MSETSEMQSIPEQEKEPVDLIKEFQDVLPRLESFRESAAIAAVKGTGIRFGIPGETGSYTFRYASNMLGAESRGDSAVLYVRDEPVESDKMGNEQAIKITRVFSPQQSETVHVEKTEMVEGRPKISMITDKAEATDIAQQALIKFKNAATPRVSVPSPTSK